MLSALGCPERMKVILACESEPKLDRNVGSSGYGQILAWLWNWRV